MNDFPISDRGNTSKRSFAFPTGTSEVGRVYGLDNEGEIDPMDCRGKLEVDWDNKTFAIKQVNGHKDFLNAEDVKNFIRQGEVSFPYWETEEDLKIFLGIANDSLVEDQSDTRRSYLSHDHEERSGCADNEMPVCSEAKTTYKNMVFGLWVILLLIVVIGTPILVGGFASVLEEVDVTGASHSAQESTDGSPSDADVISNAVIDALSGSSLTKASEQVILSQPTQAGALMRIEGDYYAQPTKENKIAFQFVNADGELVCATSCVCSYGEHKNIVSDGDSRIERSETSDIQSGTILIPLEEGEEPYAEIWYKDRGNTDNAGRFMKASRMLACLHIDQDTFDYLDSSLHDETGNHSVGNYVVLGQANIASKE